MAVKTKTANTETFSVKGADLVEKVKQLVHEGNIRRLLIKNREGRIIVEFPLTVGVVGAALVPILAAAGAIAALITECSIVVERR